MLCFVSVVNDKCTYLVSWLVNNELKCVKLGWFGMDFLWFPDWERWGILGWKAYYSAILNKLVFYF